MTNDLISRQEAIEAVSDLYWMDERLLNFRKEIDATFNKIKTLPSARQWIPTTERLPEKSGRYYVTRGLNAAGALWNRVYILNYSDLMGICNHRIWWTGNVGKSDFERIDDVLAWMPLPEPWKGGAECLTN